MMIFNPFLSGFQKLWMPFFALACSQGFQIGFHSTIQVNPPQRCVGVSTDHAKSISRKLGQTIKCLLVRWPRDWFSRTAHQRRHIAALAETHLATQCRIVYGNRYLAGETRDIVVPVRVIFLVRDLCFLLRELDRHLGSWRLQSDTQTKLATTNKMSLDGCGSNMYRVLRECLKLIGGLKVPRTLAVAVAVAVAVAIAVAVVSETRFPNRNNVPKQFPKPKQLSENNFPKQFPKPKQFSKTIFKIQTIFKNHVKPANLAF